MKRFAIVIVTLLFVVSLTAQGDYDNEMPPNEDQEFVGFNKKEKEKKDLSRLRLGGTAGLGFANNSLGFNISPLLSYQVVEDRIEIGTGIIYDYFRYKDRFDKYIVNTIGSNSMIRFYIWEGVFAQGRYVIQKSYPVWNGTKYQGEVFQNFFAGGGYQIAVAEKAFVNLGLEINIIPYETTAVSNRPPRVISPFINFQFAF